MLLLPPSEGKAAGGSRRRTWAPEAGSFGGVLAGRRAQIARALASADGGGEKLLGVHGDHLERACRANAALIGAPTLPAWQRYTGVVWEHLEARTLTPEHRRRIVVVSGLLGLVRSDDPVPDYRLKMGANLAPLGTLSRWWREELTRELARRSRRRFVVDLLPQEHRAALDLSSLRGVSLTLVDRAGKPGGHFAKAAKGELGRAILLEGAGAIESWDHPQFELLVRPLR